MAETQTRKLAAIMFTDMVGYSALTQKNEALALELLHEHRQLLRPLFSRHGGQEIKTMGDAFLVEFASAVKAARCALEMQKTLAAHNATVPPARRIQVRIGLHVGDVVYQENDVLGDGVNIASRIEPLAEPGGICVSEDVAHQIQNKVEVPVRKLGKGELKNIQVPVEIYRLVLPWEKRRVALSDRLVFNLRQKRRHAVALGLAAVVVVAGLSVWQGVGGRWRQRLLRGGGGGRIESLAVLPLDNLMGDAEQEYFVDGMTEALTADLAQIGALKVISRTSVMRYKGTEKPVPEIGRELGVDAVIEGSVLRAGNQVRITAQLIRAATDEHLWAKSYERDLTNILALQREVARAIAREIKIAVTPDEEARLASARPVNPEVYEAYLKGRYYWNKRTPDGFQKAFEQFQHAIALDPGYALAYAGLADCYILLGGYGALLETEAMPKAKAAALKALELDETLAEAHTSLAGVKGQYERDWLGAEREFRRAIELNPNYPTAHQWYAAHLAAMGRPEEGIAEMKKAQELDPLSLRISVDVGRAFYFARQYDQAIEQYRKTLELDPNFAPAHSMLGLAYVEKGLYEEAIAEIQTALGSAGELSGRLPYAYARAGKRREALKVLEQWKEQWERRRMGAANIALIYVGLGDKDQAIAWLEKAYEERSGALFMLKAYPYWDPLRSDPRFQSLLRGMNFPE